MIVPGELLRVVEILQRQRVQQRVESVVDHAPCRLRGTDLGQIAARIGSETPDEIEGFIERFQDLANRDLLRVFGERVASAATLARYDEPRLAKPVKDLLDERDGKGVALSDR